MSFFDINNILVTVWGYNICFLELLGFISGFLAIFLANRENIYTFWIGILNCICYFGIFWQQHLYSMMLLQVVFIGINIYGIVCWSFPKEEKQNLSNKLKITTLPLKEVITHCIIILLFGTIWGYVVLNLSQRFPTYFSLPPYPYIDAILLAANIVGQVWLARKKIENWILWIIVNLISIVLWFSLDMKLTAFLYLCYLFIAIDALLSWQKELKKQK